MYLSNVVIKCSKCNYTENIMLSNITRGMLCDNKMRSVTAEGHLPNAGTDKMLFAILNSPQPPTRFSICCKITGSAMADVSESSMM